jgi:hypothetical protein
MLVRWRKSKYPALVATQVIALVLLAACSSAGGPAPGNGAEGSTSTPAASRLPPVKPYAGYPDALVVLGHSGSTGESSDPSRPGDEVRENSWATGTNPDVNSLYRRILAVDPQIKDHEIALSKGGATVDDLVNQAQQAVDQQLSRPLVVIQIMDNDIVCPATTNDFDSFEERHSNRR